ncbi:hypothetical protein [Halosimplex carlsbadense]|uniref:hypothetical protein n=1 Tax=Halosimplex carlsbadense TaxID=171164 RepID=UPI000677F5AA|nr:hypothetical protein [Halosimplex carlsbadense]
MRDVSERWPDADTAVEIGGPVVATDGGESRSDTERVAGELERFAIDSALRDAWVSEFWAPADPDFGFVDYFEAAAARNLGLLGGLEELAEDIDRRGIVPQSDNEQARLVTDGGTECALHPADESPDLRYCHRCVGDTLHSWQGDHWSCDSCGRRWSA